MTKTTPVECVDAFFDFYDRQPGRVHCARDRAGGHRTPASHFMQWATAHREAFR